MTIVVLGANGQIGRSLGASLDDVVMVTRDQLDLAVPESVPELLEPIQPTMLINAAAYTQVDKAEQEEDLATLINGKAPGVLAAWCAGANIPFVHYSTDYVFNGQGEAPWKEDDTIDPVNAYGRSKRAGELAIEQAGGRYLIFRTSWVYDPYGKNFVNTMLKLASQREELSIVNDQHGAPSYAPHLAEATIQAVHSALAMQEFPSGIYHMCNAGHTSWHDFALEIFANARARGETLRLKKVEPVASEAYPTPAKRPHNSRLDCTRLKTVLDTSLPTWQEGLKECMEVKLPMAA